jgi:carboxyl-terminal processing protease
MILLNMPRAKRVLVSLIVLGSLVSSPVLAQETPPQTGEETQPVPIVYDASQDALTNRQAAVLLAEALNLTEEPWQGLFSDVGPDSADAGILEALALAGVVSGSLDAPFAPDDTITRGKFAVWVDNAFYADGFEADTSSFTDIPEGALYEAAVEKLHAAGITVGCSVDPLMFCGEDDLTLSQAEMLLARAVSLPYLVSDCEEPGQWLLLCDVYGYIDTEYVFDVTIEELVAPISEALATVEEEVEDGAPQRTQFECSIPDPLFEPVCDWAVISPQTPIPVLAETIVREVVKGLDPNSRYHNPEEWQAIEESGRYTGIGVRVVTVDEQWQAGCSPLSDTCRILILTVFEGGPAHTAGLQRGDWIVAVDGESLHGLTLGEAAGLIRGEVDTSVDITIERHGQEHRINLIRKEIVVPYTSAEFHDTESIAYIEFSTFSSYPGGAAEEFRERLTAARDSELLILDLRNNGGGAVSVLQEIAGAFLGDVPVMTFHTREETYDINGEGEPLVEADSPQMAILVNGFSASASEVLAGVLQETGRAVVIGETTYKKNTGQSLIDLYNEGVFRLTTIRWTTPGGVDIGDDGVPLDIETEFPRGTVQDLMEWVKNLLENPPDQTPEEGSENQDQGSGSGE